MDCKNLRLNYLQHTVHPRHLGCIILGEHLLHLGEKKIKYVFAGCFWSFYSYYYLMYYDATAVQSFSEIWNIKIILQEVG